MTWEVAGYIVPYLVPARGLECSSVLVPQLFRDACEVQRLQCAAALGLFRMALQTRSRRGGTTQAP